MPLRGGIRFHQRDAPALRALADRVRIGELVGNISYFEQAELAAVTGEPLEVHCSDVDELRVIVGGYIRLGVTPAAIDSLTSTPS